MKNKKVLLVSPFPFFKREFGAAVRVYGLFRMLSKKFNVFSVELGEINSEKHKHCLIQFNRKFFILEGLKVAKKIREICIKNRINIVIFSTTAVYSSYLLLLSRILLPKLSIVVDAHNTEYIIQRFKRGEIASFLTLFLEKIAFNLANKIFCVSEKDKKIISKLTKNKVIVIPNGIDITLFNARKAYFLKKFKPLLVFHGLISYKPNSEALNFILSILPNLRSTFPHLNLIVFGPGSEGVIKEGVISLGRLPYRKIPSILKQCDIAIVPIFHGSGTRLKVLEYMAAKVPIVATPKAVEGLDLVPYKHYIPASTKEEFLYFINRILKRQIKIKKMIKNSFSLVKKYDWKFISKNLIKEIEEIIQSSGR
ncbi:MAG: glycosyltransferase family 4 protein [Candidatus Aenigmatarchaeota archaeon]